MDDIDLLALLLKQSSRIGDVLLALALPFHSSLLGAMKYVGVGLGLIGLVMAMFKSLQEKLYSFNQYLVSVLLVAIFLIPMPVGPGDFTIDSASTTNTQNAWQSEVMDGLGGQGYQSETYLVSGGIMIVYKIIQGLETIVYSAIDGGLSSASGRQSGGLSGIDSLSDMGRSLNTIEEVRRPIEAYLSYCGKVDTGDHPRVSSDAWRAVGVAGGETFTLGFGHASELPDEDFITKLMGMTANANVGSLHDAISSSEQSAVRDALASYSIIPPVDQMTARQVPYYQVPTISYFAEKLTNSPTGDSQRFERRPNYQASNEMFLHPWERPGVQLTEAQQQQNLSGISPTIWYPTNCLEMYELTDRVLRNYKAGLVMSKLHHSRGGDRGGEIADVMNVVAQGINSALGAIRGAVREPLANMADGGVMDSAMAMQVTRSYWARIDQMSEAGMPNPVEQANAMAPNDFMYTQTAGDAASGFLQDTFTTIGSLWDEFKLKNYIIGAQVVVAMTIALAFVLAPLLIAIAVIPGREGSITNLINVIVTGKITLLVIYIVLVLGNHVMVSSQRWVAYSLAMNTPPTLEITTVASLGNVVLLAGIFAAGVISYMIVWNTGKPMMSGGYDAANKAMVQGMRVAATTVAAASAVGRGAAALRSAGGAGSGGVAGVGRGAGASGENLIGFNPGGGGGRGGPRGTGGGSPRLGGGGQGSLPSPGRGSLPAPPKGGSRPTGGGREDDDE